MSSTNVKRIAREGDVVVREQDQYTVINALRVAAAVYHQDAMTHCLANTGLAEQFQRQRVDAERIANELEEQ